jgi:hypothetical protein
MNRRLFRVLAISAIVTGCGPAVDPGYQPVSGTVTLDGVPLMDAVVAFQPTGEGSSGTGRTDENGTYILFYASQRPGAKVGENRVVISKETSGSSGDDEFAVVTEEEGELLPARYNRETELTATVTDSENVFDFALTSD